jgi:hypothetical protein
MNGWLIARLVPWYPHLHQNVIVMEDEQGTTALGAKLWVTIIEVETPLLAVNKPVKLAPAHKLAASFFLCVTSCGTVQYAGGGGGEPDPRERLLRNGMIKADFSGTFFAKAGANANSIL